MGVVYRAVDTASDVRWRSRCCPPRRTARPGTAPPLRPRGAVRLGAESSEHRHRSTRSATTPGRRSSRWSWSTARRSTGCSPQAAAAGRDGARLRGADCRRAGSGARRRHHPSRHQAGQHRDHARRPRQGARLRAREADRAARRPTRRSRRSVTEPGIDHGHGRLHVAGAGARDGRSMRGPTSSRSARSSTRCSPAGGRSPADPTSA